MKIKTVFLLLLMIATSAGKAYGLVSSGEYTIGPSQDYNTRVLWESVDQRLIDAYRQLAESPLPDDILQRRETAALVQMTLANLPDEYRRVLRQHYYEDRPVKEIAGTRGMSISAVKSLLYRARLAFKSAFITLLESLSDPRAAEGAVL